MRVKKGFKARRRRKEILKAARGNYSRRARTFKVARETVERGWAFNYVSRKLKKRDFRALWNIHINAVCRANGMNYSRFIGALKKNNIAIDRKILSEFSAKNPKIFEAIIAKVK